MRLRVCRKCLRKLHPNLMMRTGVCYVCWRLMGYPKGVGRMMMLPRYVKPNVDGKD